MPKCVSSHCALNAGLLPLYDADLPVENGNIESRCTYNQPDWKHNLYNHYLAPVYRYTDEAGQSHDFARTIIKTRCQSGLLKKLKDITPLAEFQPAS